MKFSKEMNLEQFATVVAAELKTVEKWSKSEGEEVKFNEFLKKLKEIKRTKK